MDTTKSNRNNFDNNNNNNGNISFSIQLKLQLQISLLQGNLQLASLVLKEKNYNNRKVKGKTEKNKIKQLKLIRM